MQAFVLVFAADEFNDIIANDGVDVACGLEELTELATNRLEQKTLFV
jgi:hypothetical protein